MRKPKTINIAGHEFHLENIETADYNYKAELYADGRYLGRVSNDGNGGMNFCYPDNEKTDKEFFARVKNDIEKDIWFTCKDGTKIHNSFGTVADRCLYATTEKSERKRPRKSKKKFKVGVRFELRYCTEVFAKNEDEAKQKALDEALQTPYESWDDDWSRAQADIIEQ